MNAVQLTHGKPYCYAKLAKASAPRERLTVSQWADRHRWLSSKQSGERGRWKTARNPMLREIMDCFSAFSSVRDLTVMKSSQVGVTEAIVNALGYTIDRDPSPVMVFMPTIESRDTWKIQKLNPLLTETDQIRSILGGLRARDSANRQDAIDFPGGILFLSGGNSPNSYAQKSARRVIMDDLDRFAEEIGDEGDPVRLGAGRLKAFSRTLLAKISTPTIKGASLIEREWEASDQRRYHVPCPACQTSQVLTWSNVRWDQTLTRAWYECADCGHQIQEHHKPKMLERGQWIAEHPHIKRRGYHISAIYAPIGLGPTWLELAQEWVDAQGEPGLLKVFINTHLGEVWEDQTTALKPAELANRAADYEARTIPVGCLAITYGIDTQDEWLAVKMLGWGADHLWILDYHEIHGDTTRQEVWDDLEAYLHAWPINAFGKTIRPRGALIDSRGHRSEQVRQFVSRTTLRIPVFYGQGATNRMNRPIAANASSIDKNSRGRVVRGGFGVWNVGTEYCKDFILGRLASDAKHAQADRYIQFPQGLTDDYYNGILSEVKDPKKNRYVQKRGAKWKRNEPLDTFVYAWAVGHHREINLGRTRTGKIDPNYWTRLEAILEPDGEVVHVPAGQAPQPEPYQPVSPQPAQQQQEPPRDPFAPISFARD
ncbi:MAG: phage terminase large subunit family protein [Roseovarius sp.]|nr:phage terminase large subunit family protein [Roseovarius sp.]